MKICIIGKIPPVQGGTPKETISFAYHLAKAGHQINVVTNALEVEPEYRIFTMDYFETCGQEARSPFKEANLKIHYTGIDRQHRFIPYNNPSVSKLANLAKEVIEKYNCELIYAIYLEPYGVVASLVSSWTKIPYVVQHAGSDIGRLFHSKKLNNTYCEVFQNASAIITNKKHIAAYLEHNISLDKIYPQPITCSFDDSQKNVMRLDLNKYIGFLKTIEHPYLVKYFKYFLEKQIDTKIPIIGIYGKTGEMKGHFDLVKALGDLKKNGAKFNLVGLIQGPEYNLRKLILLLKENNILDRTWLLPYIPHWHIGSFIKACTVICFLERDFSVTCHAPSVPTEVLFHGKCLLLSREIYEKFWLKNKLVDFKNIILTDPKNLNDLSEKLLYILKNPLAVEAINKAALDVVKIQMPTEIISNYLLGLFEQAKSNYQLSMIKKMVNDVENLFDGGFLFKVIKNLLYRSTLFKKLSKFSLKSKILQVFEDDLENVRDSSVINCFVAENYQNDLTQDQINELYLNYIKIQNPSMIDAKSIDKLYFEKVLAKSVVLWDTSRVVHENDKPIFIFYDSKNSKKTQEAFYKTLAGEIYLFRPMLKNYDSGVIKINDQTERLLKKCDGVNTIKKLFVDYDVSTVVDKILFVNMFQKLFSLGLIKF